MIFDFVKRHLQVDSENCSLILDFVGDCDKIKNVTQIELLFFQDSLKMGMD